MIIVIVGSSSGLGKALSQLLVRKGHRLFLLSRSIREADFPSGDVAKVPCDVRSPKSIQTAFKSIDKRTGTIHVLINCVGKGLEKTLEKSSDKEIEEIIETNLTGAIRITKEVYMRMLKQGFGHIINVSSTSGKKARANETVYCASKWGLAGFNESLRIEAKDKKIRVSTVFPGGMKTNFYAHSPAKVTSGYMDPKLVAQQIVNILETDPSITPSELVIERAS